MNINLQQLEMNVNLHALQPNFLNRELHYVFASGENNFRFAELDDEPQPDEQKFYCFLVDKELTIPAGNVTVKESYVLSKEPAYPIVSTAEDFMAIIDCIRENCTSKAVRKFTDDDIENIYTALQQKYVDVDRHLVKSPEFQHLLFVLPQVEISISATMVYFKEKMKITEQHYEKLKEEKAEQ